MATKKKKEATEPAEVTFNGPAGETTIRLHEDITEDLPPLWMVRYEDLVASLMAGDIGGAEFSLKLCAIFTHLPDVPGNQRIDPRRIDRGALTDRDVMGEMMRAGGEIMNFLWAREPAEEADPKNA